MARTISGCAERSRIMELSLDEYIQEQQIFIDKPVIRRVESKFKAERRDSEKTDDEADTQNHFEEPPGSNTQSKANVGNKLNSLQDLRLKVSVRSNTGGVQRGRSRQIPNTKNGNNRNWNPGQNRRNGFTNCNNGVRFSNKLDRPGGNNFENRNRFPQNFGKFGSNNNNQMLRNFSKIAINTNNYPTVPYNGNNLYLNKNGYFQNQRGLAMQTGFSSTPTNPHEGAVHIQRGDNVTLVLPKAPEIVRRSEGNALLAPGIGTINGLAALLFNGNAPGLINNAAQLFLNACGSAVIHKPIYDLDVQGEIHALQQKPLQCSNSGPISVNGRGIDACQITPHLGCMSLHQRFT